MGGLVIVAIPREEDRVWKISSEKVPHLTLLFLGEETESVAINRIASYLQHAANTSLCRFGMDVVKRGTLGPEEADVYFFGRSSRQKLEDFRSFLLTNDDIRRAYDSATQFPEWIPHLTLGFPESPAHEDTRDYPTSWVEFDRVALWTGDSEGPTFDLNDRDYALEMSGMDTVDDVLTHFGVRGMKWGVRKAARKAQRTKESSVDRRAADRTHDKSKSGRQVHKLTNKELAAAIKRINLERQYKQVVPVSPGRWLVNNGSKLAGDILLGVGKTQATRVANDQSAAAIGKVLQK